MRILTFSTLYPNAARPGHGIFVETRLRHLLAEGRLEAKVIAPVPWFPFRHACFGEYAVHARAPRAETRHGIEVLHPRYPVLPKLGMAVAAHLLHRAVLPVVAGLARSYPFELIDSHYFYPDGVAAVMLGRRLGRPVVVTARGSDVNLIAGYRIPRSLIRWAARHCAAIVTVSHSLKEALVAMGVPDSSIRVLRNGVDLRLFAPVDREATRVRLGMRRRTLLSVGNLLDFKGHDIAIRALALLPECDLLVIGSGPERARLARLAAREGLDGRVRLIGSLEQPQLREYYGAADALVLASSREGWPNVLLESMACGTPAIASDVGGSSEVIRSRTAGLLLEERTPEALARAVQALFADYPDRAATRSYAEQFGWEATSRAQRELFSDVVRGSA